MPVPDPLQPGQGNARPMPPIPLHWLGPVTIACCTIIAAAIGSSSPASESEEDASATSNVSGLYGPGAYYAWLMNAVVAACQSSTEAHEGTDANQVASVLAVAIYAGIAAVDYLSRVVDGDFGPNHVAPHRVVQVGWIISTLYLLHHLFESRPRYPSIQTSIWMLLWTLITVAMSADNVARGVLRSTALCVFVPFIVGIPIPLVALAFAGRRGWIRELRPYHYTWLLNLCTLFISCIYFACPLHLRYDAESPAAPPSSAKLSDLDQAGSLALGVVVLVPGLLRLCTRAVEKWRI